MFDYRVFSCVFYVIEEDQLVKIVLKLRTGNFFILRGFRRSRIVLPTQLVPLMMYH